MELKGKKINFLGDSITQGCGTSGEEKIFVSLIEQKTGALCRNYGISGTRLAIQKDPSDEANFDRDFCSRVVQMDDDADVVCVFGGTNDFGHGDALLGSFEDRTADTFCGALNVLYSSLLTKYPSAHIVVFTPLHRLNEENLRGDGSKAQDVAPLQTYVELIRQAAEHYSLPVLDLYAQSGLQPNVPAIRERFVPDGLHPNDAGHEILAEKIISYLRTV